MAIVLIHKYHDNINYGLADFLRASLNLFSFCKKRNYGYFIKFENQDLNKCFILGNEYLPIERKIFFGQHTLQDGIIIYREDELDSYLINSGSKVFEIDSNCINITSELYVDEYSQFIKPSKLVLDYIESVKLPEDYLAVHIRCGDKFIHKDHSFNLTECLKVVNKFICDYNSTDKVIVFSDNELLKQKFKSYGFLIHEMNIFHTNTPGVYISPGIYMQTVAEFYMIGMSKKVLAFNYSGFSHLSSFLHSKEYFNNTNNVHLQYLNKYVSII